MTELGWIAAALGWASAAMATEHIKQGKGRLAPVVVRGRRNDAATVKRLLDRDGTGCFFCGSDLDGDVTVEHLVAIAHGGPNHVSNLFLAHAECNQRAGHLSAPEKIGLAIAQRSTPSLADAPAERRAEMES